MHPVLSSFQQHLTRGNTIRDRIVARDGVDMRPASGTRAVAGRLKRGLRVLAAYIRRVLILMALALEPDLTPTEPDDNRRPDGRTRTKGRTPQFRVFPADANPDVPDFAAFKAAEVSTVPVFMHRDVATDRFIAGPVLVPLGGLLARLDQLQAIVQDPMARARRLAFYLARSRHGRLLPPRDHPGVPVRWGTKASALYDVMGHQIVEQSRSRPPPLPPPCRGKPTVTLL